MRRLPVLMFLALAPVAGALADDCPWMAAAKLDELWPDAAPWDVMVGGPGSCKFTSDSTRPANIVGANQMIKASAAEAETFVASLQGTMAKSYEVAPVPALGKAAFTYKPKPGTGMEGRSLYFVAHQGNVAVIVSMTMQETVTPKDVAAGESFARAALSLADDPKAQAEATNCPWFDKAVLAKLLPGKDMSQQQFGNSCMAQADGAVVIVKIVEDLDPATIARFTDGGCSSEPVPALGDQAAMTWACPGGKPHATVRYAHGADMVEYNFAPDREPTPAERALLVELATKAPARR